MTCLCDLMDSLRGRNYKMRNRIGKRWQIYGDVIFVITMEQRLVASRVSWMCWYQWEPLITSLGSWNL